MMKKWYPVRIKYIDEIDYYEWAYFENQNFNDPFFEETWSKAKSHPYNSSRYVSITSAAIINNWVKKVKINPPKAIIFHCSRCGSTLISQFLSMNAAHISLSEVPLFDKLLRLTLKTNSKKKGDYLELFKNTVKWFGQFDDKISKNLFIKTDSWHFYFWKQYKALFSKTPLVIIYRNPLEIFESQNKLKGMHAVPHVLEPQLFNLSVDDLKNMSQQEYFGKVLEFYFSTIIKIKQDEPQTLLLNYKDGGLNMIYKLYQHLGLKISENDKLKFVERVQYHSKKSDLLFKEDLKLKNIPPYLKNSVLLYQKIDRLRNV